IVARESPVPPRLKIPEAELFRKTEFDAGDTIRDLARDKLQASTRALVIEKYPGDRVETVTLAIVDRDPMAVDFRNAIWRARIERCPLALRGLDDLPEHLAGARLIEARLRRRFSHRLQHARHANRGEFSREDGLRPRRLHEALSRQIVNFIRGTGEHRVH